MSSRLISRKTKAVRNSGLSAKGGLGRRLYFEPLEDRRLLSGISLVDLAINPGHLTYGEEVNFSVKALDDKGEIISSGAKILFAESDPAGYSTGLYASFDSASQRWEYESGWETSYVPAGTHTIVASWFLYWEDPEHTKPIYAESAPLVMIVDKASTYTVEYMAAYNTVHTNQIVVDVRNQSLRGGDVTGTAILTADGVPVDILVLDGWPTTHVATLPDWVFAKKDEVGHLTTVLKATYSGDGNLLPSDSRDIPLQDLLWGRSVHGWVWDDLDANGFRDADEPGTANTTVSLYKASGSTIDPDNDTLVGTTQTEGNGEYVFRYFDVDHSKKYYAVFPSSADYFFADPEPAPPRDPERVSSVDPDGYTAFFSTQPSVSVHANAGTVQKASWHATRTTISSAPSSAMVGRPVTLVAQVTCVDDPTAIPTGEVGFLVYLRDDHYVWREIDRVDLVQGSATSSDYAFDTPGIWKVEAYFVRDATGHNTFASSHDTVEVSVNVVPLKTPKITAPKQNAAIVYNKGQRDVEIKWNKVSGATRYTVLVKDLSRKEEYPPYTVYAPNLKKYVAGLAAGKYEVRVQAEHFDGQYTTGWSEPSAPCNFEVRPGKPTLKGPSGRLVRAGANASVRVAWQEVDVPFEVDHYEVWMYDRTAGGDPKKYPGTVDVGSISQGLSIPAAEIKDGHRYGFYVRGCGPESADPQVPMVTGAWSNYLWVDLRPRAPVMTGPAASGDNHPVISWTRPGGADVDYYILEVRNVKTRKVARLVVRDSSEEVKYQINLTSTKVGYKYEFSVKAFGPKSTVKGTPTVQGIASIPLVYTIDTIV